MGIDERNGIQCEGGNARCIVGHIFDAEDRIRSSQRKLQRETRSSQPSGSLCCGRRWHFRKPALGTDQFKLKVVSRSKLHIYTLNVSCIMLVYYFVQFIANNRYLLF